MIGLDSKQATRQWFGSPRLLVSNGRPNSLRCCGCREATITPTANRKGNAILRSRLSLAVFLAYWVALVVGTHLPAEHVPRHLSIADKALHFMAYAGLSVLLMTLVSQRRSIRQSVVWILAALMIHGAVDEWSQAFSPGRAPDITDWVANCCGALVGVGAAWAFLSTLTFWRWTERLHPVTAAHANSTLPRNNATQECPDRDAAVCLDNTVH